MPISIRQATESDAPALSRICLLTGAAGVSAEPLHKHGELPGLIFAVPYVKLKDAHTFGFVLEDDASGEVGGYVLGTSDTRAFEKAAHEQWWPDLQAKYPVEKIQADGTDEDVRFAKLFCNMWTTPEQSIAFSPAHLHIDILPAFQRLGWGKKLIGKVVDELKSKGVQRLWVGLDPKNESAKVFYGKIGFKPIDSPGTNLGLSFDDWDDAQPVRAFHGIICPAIAYLFLAEIFDRREEVDDLQLIVYEEIQ